MVTVKGAHRIPSCKNCGFGCTCSVYELMPLAFSAGMCQACCAGNCLEVLIPWTAIQTRKSHEGKLLKLPRSARTDMCGQAAHFQEGVANLRHERRGKGAC